MNEQQLLKVISEATRHRATLKRSRITTNVYIVCGDCDATLGYIDDANVAQPPAEKIRKCKGDAK